MSIRNYLKRGFQYIINGIPEKHIKVDIAYLLPNQRLADKRIVITGGGKGIGLAITKKCLSEGAEVLITGRDKVTLKKVASECGCKYLQLDVLNVDEFPPFLKKADELLGGIL